MHDLHDRLSVKFPQLKSRYRMPASFYLEAACRCSPLKTLWHSLRFRGPVVVGRGSKVRVHRTARIALAPRAMLVIGMANDTPVGAVLRMHPRSKLSLDGRVLIMRASIVTVGYDATLTIGADAFFNDGSSIVCHSSTTIGADCAISWGVRILDTDIHEVIREGSTGPRAPVRIGRHCWIGANALVMKGAQLGDGTVVAAGAVVTSEIPPHSLVTGIPGRAIRGNVTWAL